jgi:hypothetical protein
VVAVHEPTVDRPLKRERVRDLVRPSQISRPRTRASETRRRRRRRVAVRGEGSPALPLGGAPDHHFVHEPVHFEAGALAHVIGRSRG